MMRGQAEGERWIYSPFKSINLCARTYRNLHVSFVLGAPDQSEGTRAMAAVSPDRNPSTRTQGGAIFRDTRSKWTCLTYQPANFLHETLQLHNISIQKCVDSMIATFRFVFSRARVSQLTRTNTAYQRFEDEEGAYVQ